MKIECVETKKMSQRIVHILRTGIINFDQGLNLQRHIAKKYNEIGDHDQRQFKNVLILTEHHPVYTIGIRTKGYILEDEQRLNALGAQFHKTNRGGLIMFHGPGQLVAYPIINLKDFKPSIRWYVCHLEKTIIELCGRLGLSAATSPDTGVWIGNNKICAIGVHGSRFITTHGLALNCDVDLKWFEHIVPCGLVGKGVTSLTRELNKECTVQQAIPLLIDSFQKTFDCTLVECSPDDTREYLEHL